MIAAYVAHSGPQSRGEYGVETLILRNGITIARTFVLRGVAVGWAKNERDRLEGDDPFT